mmetsp:Transcript_33181/g.91752  ORF Transcript_33181/g.91752 Transcript_33181/m.91752 type:complete len:600 (+) Transcript_33181:841-2640(+)
MRSRPSKLAQVACCGMLAPHRLRPECSPVNIVLQVIADDVRLLEEEAHGVCETQVERLLLGIRTERPDALALSGERVLLQATGHEEACQSLSDQACHHVAVAVVCCLVDCPLPQVRRDVLGHAGAHLVRDVPDHRLRAARKRVEDAHDLPEVHDQHTFIASSHSLNAAVGVGQPHCTELPQLNLLVSLTAAVRIHVVLNGVKCSKHEVEDANVEAQAHRQLLDHSRKRSRHLTEHVVAEHDVLIFAISFQAVLKQPSKLEAQTGQHLQRPRELVQLGGGVRGHLAVGALLQASRRALDLRLAAPHETHDALLVLCSQNEGAPLRLVSLLHGHRLRSRKAIQVGHRTTSAAMILRPCVKAVNRQGVHILVGREGCVQVLPPAVQEALGDDAEPRGPQRHLARQRRFASIHRGTQLITAKPLDCAHFLSVRMQRQLLTRLQAVQEQVVDFVFAPGCIRAVGSHIGCPVVHPRDELEASHVELGSGDAQLVLQLPHRGVLDPRWVACCHRLWRVQLWWPHAVQRVAAARVRPHIREGDLRRRPLLEQKPVFGIKQHHGEGAVQDTFGLAGDELVAIVLVVVAHHLVHVVQCNALVLQHEILL